MITVQYLEPGPHLAAITPEMGRARLRTAFDRLPIASVILGWNLPNALQQACAQEIDRAGAQLYLWHPLLTSDTVTAPRAEYRKEESEYDT